MKLELNISKKVELRHPDDVEGHRLVKEKFLEKSYKEISARATRSKICRRKKKQNVFPEEVIAEAENAWF